MWVVADLDDDYISKMEDVLEVYERPYDPQQPVVCLDEKPVTLHAEVRPRSAAAPGREARQDSEYKRCGTANIFCAVEPKAGRHFTFATPDRSGFEFAQVAVTLALAYPEADTIHLVMDNLNILRIPVEVGVAKVKWRPALGSTAQKTLAVPQRSSIAVKRCFWLSSSTSAALGLCFSYSARSKPPC